jgi:HSF-type DNA-binding
MDGNWSQAAESANTATAGTLASVDTCTVEAVSSSMGPPSISLTSLTASTMDANAVVAADPAVSVPNANANPKCKESSSKKSKRRGPKPKIKLPVEPRVLQTIPKRKEYVNHSYSDFSMVPPMPNYAPPTSIEEMSFSEKVFDILNQPHLYGKYISWRPHGRAFCVTVPTMFEKHVCVTYFGHKRYSSFLRQVNNHGFKHLTAGNDRNCYYHEVCHVSRRVEHRATRDRHHSLSLTHTRSVF